MPPTIDVVMPTWNSALMLSRTLAPLRQGLRPEHIIIVDRSSEDGTRGVAQEHGATVLIDVTSLGSARMRGVAHSSADWIAFIDDDILIPSGFREAMERFMLPGVGAIQAGAVSIHEPYRTIHLEEFEARMGGGDHFDHRPGERGYTNATLVRRHLLDGLDLTRVDTWEDWVITQRVLSSGHRWLVVRPFVDHIHEREDLAMKEGWNAAGILNLARTGHMPVRTAVRQFGGKIALALKGAVKYTVLLRSPGVFAEYVRFIASIALSPRHLLRTRPRRVKVGASSAPSLAPREEKQG